MVFILSILYILSDIPDKRIDFVKIYAKEVTWN